MDTITRIERKIENAFITIERKEEEIRVLKKVVEELYKRLLKVHKNHGHNN